MFQDSERKSVPTHTITLQPCFKLRNQLPFTMSFCLEVGVALLLSASKINVHNLVVVACTMLDSSRYICDIRPGNIGC